ncbi:MAG: NAD(P)/FAD-dependent oxidoreductase [Flavobacteriales bacterium]|nr:NAD(P)/FAD-dependent oxidoreductase [Flavobacteriales bacterium]
MKIAIIGGGAAGCFAAANIPEKTGQEVVLFEKTGKLLQKVKVSGGGRCNVTHACFDIPALVERYPRGKQLLRKSFYQFGPSDTLNWFKKHGVALKTETDGRIFPVTDDSQTIIDCLIRAMQKQNVQIQLHKTVTKIYKNQNTWDIHFSDHTVFTAHRILIAPGGYSKAEQYRWIEALGHSIQPPVPSLFTFNMPQHPITQLMGITVQDATVKIAGTKWQESGPILITHWGLSGPAVLKLSAWAARDLFARNYQFDVLVNWLNQITEEELRNIISNLRKIHGKRTVLSYCPFDLPRRLWEFFIGQLHINSTLKWGELPSNLQNKIIDSLIRHRITVNGKTTFKEEFVTCGGVCLNEIDPQTMQSKLVKGIYFAGEIMDVDGITGGYNFQHAWTSAWIAAQNIIRH